MKFGSFLALLFYVTVVLHVQNIYNLEFIINTHISIMTVFSVLGFIMACGLYLTDSGDAKVRYAATYYFDSKKLTLLDKVMIRVVGCILPAIILVIYKGSNTGTYLLITVYIINIVNSHMAENMVDYTLKHFGIERLMKYQ